MSDDVAFRMLKTRLGMEREHTKRELLSSLRALRHEIDSALKAVESDDRVNAHMIANSHMITEITARWNLTRELLPMIQDDEGRG